MWTGNDNKINITFIRHGKTQLNLERRYAGVTDDALCEQGIEEINKLVQSGYYPEVGLIFVSPMRRCIETAKLIYPDRDYVIIDEIYEMNFGRFEGKCYEELKDNIDYQRFIDSGGTAAFPEGESRAEFTKRTVDGIRKVLDVAREKQCADISIIAHGGTLMAVMAGMLGMNYYDYQIKNGEKYSIAVE